MSDPASPPPGSRPLSAPALVAAGLALFGVYLVLLRFSYGTWKRGAAASLAPAIFCAGLFVLWLVERRSGRALLSRIGTVVLLAALGVLAGATAPLMIRTLGSPWAGAIPGLFYGTLMGIGWSRRPPAPGPRAAAADPQRPPDS